MKEKRKWRLIPLILVLNLVIGSLVLRIGKGLWVRMLLDRVWKQEHMVCAVHMEMPLEYGDASISWDTVGEERYFTLDVGPESLYLHDGALFFSNGTGYSLDGLLEELPFTEEQLRKALIFAPWERHSDAGYDAWILTLSEKPGFLIRTFFPEAEQYWTQLRSLNLTLYEESRHLRYLHIGHEDLSVYLELKKEQPKPVPTDMVMQMGTAPLPDIRTLEPLIRACMELNQPGSVPGELTIQVECGPLPIQDTARILLSEDGLHLGRGDSWTALSPDSVTREELLLGVGWMLLREGVWEAAEPDGGTMGLTLKADRIYTSLLSIIPELEGLDLTLNDGELVIRIDGNRFNEIGMTCSGSLPFLFTEIPIHLELTLTT